MHSSNRPSPSKPGSGSSRISIQNLAGASSSSSSRTQRTTPSIQNLLSQSGSSSQAGSSSRPGSSSQAGSSSSARPSPSGGVMKNMWTSAEDKRLQELVGSSPANWNAIASKLPGCIAKQCRERWANHLSPKIRKGSWSKREDAILFYVNRRGSKTNGPKSLACFREGPRVRSQKWGNQEKKRTNYKLLRETVCS